MFGRFLRRFFRAGSVWTPRAVVVLFAGGHGGLKISPAGTLGWGTGNFLLRPRQLFLADHCLDPNPLPVACLVDWNQSGHPIGGLCVDPVDWR